MPSSPVEPGRDHHAALALFGHVLRHGLGHPARLAAVLLHHPLAGRIRVATQVHGVTADLARLGLLGQQRQD